MGPVKDLTLRHPRRRGQALSGAHHIIPPDTQRMTAERARATITHVASSHVSMVSHPQVAIDAILAAVAAVAVAALTRSPSARRSRPTAMKSQTPAAEMMASVRNPARSPISNP